VQCGKLQGQGARRWYSARSKMQGYWGNTLALTVLPLALPLMSHD